MNVKPKNSARHSIQQFFTSRLALLALLLAVCGMLAPSRALAVGTWTPLANTAPESIALMLQLSDGSVMCQGNLNTNWYRLTPDTNGSYANGTWTKLAPMHDSRLYFCSQVLNDGRVLVGGGEYGTVTSNLTCEVYQPTNNTWTLTPSIGVAISDGESVVLPNGNVMVQPVNDPLGTRIFNIASNTWSNGPTLLNDQNEASWVKLPDQSILTIDDGSITTERYIPSLNQWVPDGTVPVNLYNYKSELGAGYLLPNGKVFFLGSTNQTAIYTPWTTNYAGIYTPAGATNAGSWSLGPVIPNNLGANDAPSAMLPNGKILCAFGDDNNQNPPTYFYEYDYVDNTFTQVASPTGGSADTNYACYQGTMLDLPDGTVLYAHEGADLYIYKPDASPLAAGQPVISSVTTNLDGSFHVTGTLFDGISEGAEYGDDWQMDSDFPIARLTNSAGAIQFARTYNWSSSSVMTGTNILTTELTLPGGLLAGTYPLVITANGISSAPFSLTTSGTPLPPVSGLAFTSIASSQMAFGWNAIGLTEAGYVIQRSTDGSSFSTIASVGSNVTTYADNTVSPFSTYYYRIFGTNVIGLGNAGPAILSASPSTLALSAPWLAQDIGSPLGSGASSLSSGIFTIIGSAGSIGGSSDQFQYAFQPIAGNVTITARVTAQQNTGAGALAGVMIRNGLGGGSLDVFMAFSGGTTNSVFQARTSGGGNATSTAGPGSLNAPLWVQLVRSGNTITGYTSPDGSTWTQRGTVSIGMEPVVYAGLAVCSGNNTLLNTATFDNVTVTGTPATTAPPLADWKLDETSGTTALDSRSGYNGTYNTNCVLGQTGATPNTGTSVGFNGTNAYISVPPLNLNNNTVTITAWVNPNGNQSQYEGIFYNGANSTSSGLTFGSGNQLGYIWNFVPGTYGFGSGLVLPTNQWTFVALVVEPTRARLYMVTNGILSGATNNVANLVQAFDGVSTIGQSPFGKFTGLLDEVSFFANQALTPSQISQLAVVVNTHPTNMVFSVSGTNLNLSWPADHTGWRLQIQTNHLANGVSGNTNDWGTVSGSTGTNQIIAPIDPTKPAEFYRLVYP